MTKFQLNLGMLIVISAVVCVIADEVAQPKPAIEIDKPKNIKIYVEDHSRVLTPEEVDKLANKDSLPVARPVVDPMPNKVEPKQAGLVDDAKIKLPPIPIILPNIPFNLQLPNSNQNDDASNGDDAPSKPKGIISVLFMHSSNNLADANDDSKSDLTDDSTGGTIKSSFVIFKVLSKSFNDMLGYGGADSSSSSIGNVDTDASTDTESKFGQKLFGGSDDVDHKRVHLLGGGGDNDPDRLRFKFDDDNTDDVKQGVFTGGDDIIINSEPSERHKIMIISMYDRIRNLLGIDSDQSIDDSSAPFIIRTDDGSPAIIPNDIGYAEKQQQSLNKCMMLNFMRLKASMYYRTILHLLFFTGVMLFILSLIMLTVRSFRRRQCMRRPLSISTIDTQGGAASKFNSYRAWSGDIEQSLIGSDSKIVLIQAPPAYDQVIINDKTSSLTNQSSKLLTTAPVINDDCETKSLPPDYEKSVNNN